MTEEFKTGVIKPVECMKEGWELIKDQYWMFFGITFVGMLIGSVVPFGIILGAMYCGIYYTMMQKMDGRPFEFADVFKGFNYFGASLVATLIFIIPIFVFTIITWISMASVMYTMMDSHGGDPTAAVFTLYGVMFGEGLVFAIILSCIHAFIIFTYPLIVERNLSGIEAFKLSSRAAWNNLGGVVGLILTEFVLGLLGYLVCAVGVYFTIPIMFAGVLVAYRKVFPAQHNFAQTPPPPNAYTDAGRYT